MSSIVQTFQKRSQTLPLSLSPSDQDHHHHHHDQNIQNQDDNNNNQGLIRRRLSSLSYKIQAPLGASSAAATWAALRRSKSVSAMGGHAGESIRDWWARGWAWVLSRKPTFARDLEMNEEESKAIGPTCRGTWRHVIFKVRSEIRRLVRANRHVGLPQTCRYNSFDYSKNFDDGSVRTRLVS